MLNVKFSPRRMLNRKEAAEYCGLPASRFPANCAVAPVLMPHGSLLYDTQDLDAWLDAIKIGSSASDDEILGQLT